MARFLEVAALEELELGCLGCLGFGDKSSVTEIIIVSCACSCYAREVGVGVNDSERTGVSLRWLRWLLHFCRRDMLPGWAV